MRRIKRFLERDFGLGGAPDYAPEQVRKALEVITAFYSPELGDVERDSILKFLWKCEREDGNYRKRVNELMAEASEYEELL